MPAKHRQRTIFVLEDLLLPERLFRYELGLATGKPEPGFENVIFSLARGEDDGISIIKVSAPFDLWSLDFDLGFRGTGLGFLEIVKKWPEKWPKDIRVHSSHSDHRQELLEAIAAARAEFKQR